ncbi:hypothetical protein [Acidovorax sp. NCPPB 4044]|nr:hypothetical protein [Acidovorax sp. NCPPB 4044]MDA8522001.1 hypothetical protein [Acidovorax sp. NCPPB 4044]
MKPRIFLQRGLWHCYSRTAAARHLGVGYCPRSAYQDWKALREAQA